MRQLNLTYIHSTNLAANDTSETFVVNNAISLAEKGAFVKLIVINSGNKSPESTIKERHKLESLPDNLIVKAFKNRFNTKFLFYLFACFQLMFNTRDKIIITRTHALVPFLVLLFGKSRKIFFETHDFFYDLSVRKDINRKRKKRKSAIEREYFNKLTGLICLNTHQQELYRKYIKGVVIEVFPTGLNDVHENYENRTQQIVYVGSLNKRSGAERLAALISGEKGRKFVIVGGKTEEEINYFTTLFPQKEIPPNLKITGWTDKEELKKILLKSNYALLPLTDTFFNRYLTVPLKLFDYFSHGLVTLAPDYPSCSDFIQDQVNGYLVDWSNLDNIKQILHKPVYESMREAIYRQAENMKWGQRATDQINYFNKISQDV